eukprot:1665892-Rhodomonas_salina.1
MGQQLQHGPAWVSSFNMGQHGSAWVNIMMGRSFRSFGRLFCKNNKHLVAVVLSSKQPEKKVTVHVRDPSLNVTSEGHGG